MEKHEDIVLKKLGRRKKMFEDYIALAKRRDRARGIMKRNMGEVRREELKETQKELECLVWRGVQDT